MGASLPDPILALWAKSARGSAGYHPLICHLIDVAAVARLFWDEVLPPAARDRLAGSWGVSPEVGGHWAALLAGLHDLGKCSPAFQLHPAVGARDRLLRAGFRCPETPRRPAHGTITAGTLPDLLDDRLGVSFDVARRLATVTGGHHGIFPSARQIDDLPPGEVGRGLWEQARGDLVAALGDLLELPGRPPPGDLDNAAALYLAGLISVTDWIGSGEDFAYRAPNGIPEVGDLTIYRDEAAGQARSALARLGWLGWSRPVGRWSFGDLFPEIAAPRPLQMAALEVGDRIVGPGLVVIEAPMGEGKTEAALALLDRARTPGGYVALPTQATSNQMFGRVRAFLARRYAGRSIQLQLLHGGAILSTEFEDLRRAGEAEAIEPTEIYDESGATPGQVIAREWFTQRKRGLLAPFGVGTVDQALLAALQTRHVFVRLFGLAHKTVIVDEVHAYDTYMSTLLERLLEWLAALGCTVILLSATLPRRRRDGLIAAYRRGRGAADAATPGPSGAVADAATPGPGSPAASAAVAAPGAAVAGAVASGGDPVPTSAAAPAGATIPAPDPAPAPARYPRIAWTDGATTGVVAIATSPDAVKTARIAWITAPEDDDPFPQLGPRLWETLAEGGCAAVICNTVGRAQAAYRALRPFFPGAADDGWPEIDLLHARFLFADRDDREKRALIRFGKAGATVDLGEGEARPVRRPRRAVLVATQVIEQSLDLDFDLLVTDPAPADLILQRAGRLHRHRRADRPAALATPAIWILRPPEFGGVPRFDPGSAAVYQPHILLRTWLALPPDRSAIAIPGEVEGLIEAVYDDRSPPPDLPAPLAAEWAKTAVRLGTERDRLERLAARARIESPMFTGDVLDVRSLILEEDTPELHPTAQALTRIGDPSVPVVLLPAAEAAQAEAGTPTAARARALLRRSVGLGRRGLTDRILRQDPPAGWRRSALLRHHRLLPLDEAGTWRDAPYRVTLDPDLGVIIATDKEE